jgi:hypothetical protein
VRLDSVGSASAIRKAFAEKSKGKKLTGDYERMFITNSVNLATRVRIDVMKAISRKLTTPDVQAYVVGFISRPVMHVKKRSTNSQRSYTFVDAINFYGHLIQPLDLAIAYKRAGKAFDGQLEQNFIVLNEGDREICWAETVSDAAGNGNGSGNAGRGGAHSSRGPGPGDRRGTKRGSSPAKETSHRSKHYKK